MQIGLIADIIVAALLVMTLVTATVLYVRLGRVRRSRADMEATLASFTTLAERAEHSLNAFRTMSEEANGALDHNVERARGLKEELEFLIDKAESVSSRLMAERAAASAPAPAAPQPTGRPAPQPSSSGGLIKALRGRGGHQDERAAARYPDAPVQQRPSEAEQALLKALQAAR